MALLATITPNILSYIRELLHLQAPTCFYKQPSNRPNIVQMVAPIIKPGFSELDFLILKTGLIPKTIVFVDKIDNAMKIAAYLCLLLPPENREQENVLIRTFYSNFEVSTCLDFIENFRNRDTGILICTNATGIGINIPNITRVIQWKWSEQLTFTILMQHIGQAERNLRIAAVTILFIEDCYLLPKNVSTLAKNLFKNKTMPVFPTNRVEVDAAISLLYTDNMQIRKERGSNYYY